MKSPELLPNMPMTALAIDYGPKEVVAAHRHPVCQLIYAVKGVMVVTTHDGRWIVPATRAVWVPANVEHSIRMVGRVALRTLYLRPTFASKSTRALHGCRDFGTGA